MVYLCFIGGWLAGLGIAWFVNKIDFYFFKKKMENNA